MNVEQLRDLWRQKRGQEPPAAFSKDLIARALAYWLQEEVLGGLDARVRKLLGASSRRDGPPARHVKVGSVIVREYQGKLHEVLVVPGGFCWQGQIFREPVDHRPQDHRNQLERAPLLRLARRRGGSRLQTRGHLRRRQTDTRPAPAIRVRSGPDLAPNIAGGTA